MLSQRRRKKQRGATIVETALILLVLLSMITFVMDMGRFLLIQQYITERARDAARMAAVNNWNQTTVANYFAYGSTTAPAGGTSTPGVLGLLPSNLAYSTVGTS